jgi:nicotinate-nucleotide adenylyltransferase
MKVGVLGGTFDPVHLGHLILADQAREALALDEMLFIPAGEPWRKSSREITTAEHRLAMLGAAIDGNDAFGISEVELRRPGPTYTADTLEALAGERLDDIFYFIIGADALADLPAWHDPARIVLHALLAVAPRDGLPATRRVPGVPGIEGRIEQFAMPRIEISSTDIRARVAAGTSIRYMVPAAVEAYIRKHKLYV